MIRYWCAKSPVLLNKVEAPANDGLPVPLDIELVPWGRAGRAPGIVAGMTATLRPDMASPWWATSPNTSRSLWSDIASSSELWDGRRWCSRTLYSPSTSASASASSSSLSSVFRSALRALSSPPPPRLPVHRVRWWVIYSSLFTSNGSKNSKIIVLLRGKQICRSLLIVGPKCTLAASHVAPWWVTVSMPTRQTDGRMDAKPLHYAFRYGRGQRNNFKYS